MHVFGFPFHEGPRPARVRINSTVLFVLSVIWVLSVGAPAFAKTPPAGDKAPDFTLSTPSGKAVRMSGMQQGHDLVLVVLRGFPGYQCPYCMKQVHDFVEHASAFAEKNTHGDVKTALRYQHPDPAELQRKLEAAETTGRVQ